MRRSTSIGTILTLLMFLLILVAAVVFMASRLAELDQTSDRLESTRVALSATRDQLLSDVAVRESALGLIGATRDALADEADERQGTLDALEGQLSQQEATLNDAQDELDQLALQLFIFSPKDGAIIRPNEPIELFLAARADEGVDRVELSVSGESLASFPAEGQNSFTLRYEWTPMREGPYEISAVAHGPDGSVSRTETVRISATYGSDAARVQALRGQVETAIGGLRVPEPTAEPAAPKLSSQDIDDLHANLLTGVTESSALSLDNETLVLQTLGLLPEAGELDAYTRLIFEQRAVGYYDADADEVSVFIAGDGTEPFGLWSYVHVVVHQLQEERHGLTALEPGSLDADARLALRALVEGEASLMQHLTLQSEVASEQEKEAIRQGIEGAALAEVGDLPHYLSESFAFAYRDGFRFVQFLEQQGGFEAIDAAWLDMPKSSEQILHPDSYLTGDLPQPVALAPMVDALGSGWELIGGDVLGEFVLRQHLRAQLGAEEVDLAATGWGGGRYAVYQNAEEALVAAVIRLAWDDAAEGQQFGDAYERFLDLQSGVEAVDRGDAGLCWLAEDVVCLHLLGAEHLIVRAPTVELADQIAAIQAAGEAR